LQISELNTWLRAARPQTLVAALIPVLVGACLAWKDDHFHTTASSIALLCAFLIQIGTNFANDYFDYVKGADNEERIGFVRATSAGLITPEKMFTATVITMSLAFIFGLYLVWLGGWVILILGVLSLIFGILYTGGPFPLGYNGLGDIFVFIFFGFIAVTGTYYVNALEWSEISFWAAVPVGALCTNILVVNNLRDTEQDKKAGKKTLGVLFGENILKWEYTLMVVISYAVPVLIWIYFEYNFWILLPFAALPLGINHIFKTWKEADKRKLNKHLEHTAIFMGIFGFLFSIGIILS